jgi:APA family basic amino acid/polyamine antiporter
MTPAFSHMPSTDAGTSGSTGLAHGGAGRLRRLLGVGFGLAVVIGSTIGVGILRTPGLVAAAIPHAMPILALWIVGGLYTLLGSICLTEVGAMLPQAGGYYVYARRAFGDATGFAVGWTDWLTYCCALGYLAIGLMQFLATLVPALAGSVTPLAMLAMVAFVALQWAGLRVSSRFQEVTTAIKFAAFAAIVVAAFVHAARAGMPAPVDVPAASGGSVWAGVINALQSVVITYAGWQSALYFTEEDRAPARNLPRAMIGGVVAVIAIYVAVNAALLAVLPMDVLARSTLAGADAAGVILGPRGAAFITALAVVSLVPTINAILMIGTRILFALSRDGLFWRRAADVNAGGTPGVATVATTVVVLALIATGTITQLIALTACFLAANYAICCAALVVLRRREPGLERPFRAWGYPWSAAIVLAGAAIFLIGVFAGDTRNGAIALGLLVAGLVGRAIVNARAGRRRLESSRP